MPKAKKNLNHEARLNQLRELAQPKGAFWLRTTLSAAGVRRITDLPEAILDYEIARLGIEQRNARVFGINTPV